jgi:hypothetical protein
MNLHSRKARAPIAALGVIALCTGGMGAFASSAFAAAPASLTLNSGGNTQAVGNFGFATAAASNAAYALKVTDADSSSAVTLKLVSAPTAGNLSYARVTGNAAAGTSFTSVSVGGVNEVETVTITGAPTGGTFTLTYGGSTTGAIAYSATAATVQTALVGLSSIGAGNVAVTGSAGGPYTVTFQGTLAATNVTAITGSGASLTGGTSPAVAVSTPTQGVADNSTSTISAPLAATDYVYVTGDVPGAYTYRLFEDTNANSVYDSADERSSDLVTLNVYDVGGTGTTTTTADDAVPVITAASPGAIGQAIVAGVSYSKPLSMTDARGSGVATGLAGRLAALTFFDVAPGSGIVGISSSTENVSSYSTTTGATTFAVGTSSGPGTVVLRADLKPGATSGSPAFADNLSYGSKSVVVNDNNVTALTLTPTLVDGKVINTSGAVTVKAGTAAVTYTSTATGLASALIPGATVNFTVAGTAANVALLSTDGTVVDTSSTTSHVYSAVTNASGVASLTVTSSSPVAAGTYTVAATSNGHSATPTLTTTYAAPAAAAIATTSTTAELTPAVGATSVTLKGKLTDQFGAAYVPASSASQQVGIEIPDGSAVGFSTIGTDGTFSYVYTPATAQTAGSSVTFDFSYTGLADIASPGGTIRWASTTAAGVVTITAPADAATGLALQKHTAPTGTGLAVTGTVADATNVGLAFKTVVLTGSDGVYFAGDVNGTNMSKSYTAVTDNSGAIQSAFVFFTKAGTAKVTATAGTATDTNTVTTAVSSDPYKIVVDDIAGSPGATLIVTGKVTDMFGNGVPSNGVELSTGSSTVGTVMNSNPSTNADGVFSTSFVSGTNSSGVVTLTGTLDTNPGGVPMTSATVLAPNSTWKTVAGLDFPDGDYQADGKITVAAVKLTLSATAKVVGTGSTKLSGMFSPNTAVDIWAKPSGGSYSFTDSVTTDDSGAYSITLPINKSTYFLARASGLSSPSDLTTVMSAVTLTGKTLGRGQVKLTANGAPNVRGTLTFYRSIAGRDPILKSLNSDVDGNGSATVKLPKGMRSVYVIFKAPGTGAGTSKTLKITVK